MKRLFIILPFLLLLYLKGQSQSTIYVCLGESSYQSISASSIVLSDDGSTFSCSGDVSITDIADPDPSDGDPSKPKCGGTTGWYCGKVTITTSGDVTYVHCEGSSGRCAKIATE